MRLLIASAAAAAALMLVAAPAQAGGSPSVKVTACKTGDQPIARLATFAGSMSRVKGTNRMAMRFKLRATTPGQARSNAVSDPKLAPWRRSRAGVSRFVYSQTVRGLEPGVAYHVTVIFRWYDSDGDVIKESRRQSGTCLQDASLPNLVLSSARAKPLEDDMASYSVRVRNAGSGVARNFAVTFIADGKVVESRTVRRLDPGESKRVKFYAPVCDRLRFVVDRRDELPETVESDNSLRARC